MKRAVVWTGLVLAVWVISPLESAWAAGPEPVIIAYEGELLDERKRPVAGVFALEFSLFRRQNDRTPAWREKHWVAVTDGRYAVRLGAERKIKPSLAKPGDTVYLGVSLNRAELTREALTLPVPEPAAQAKVAPAQPSAPEAKATPAPSRGTRAPAKKTEYKSEAGFADVADYANRAGVAENAEQLGGKSLADLEARIRELETRLTRHQGDDDAHAGGGSVTVGADNKVLPRAGGSGGRSFRRDCPPGYVVTGIRGGAGALIDYIQVVCSPLEESR